MVVGQPQHIQGLHQKQANLQSLLYHRTRWAVCGFTSQSATSLWQHTDAPQSRWCAGWFQIPCACTLRLSFLSLIFSHSPSQKAPFFLFPQWLSRVKGYANKVSRAGCSDMGQGQNGAASSAVSCPTFSVTIASASNFAKLVEAERTTTSTIHIDVHSWILYSAWVQLSITDTTVSTT
jgi:hypothetical protein